MEKSEAHAANVKERQATNVVNFMGEICLRGDGNSN
jgi:hypothetical protein